MLIAVRTNRAAIVKPMTRTAIVNVVCVMVGTSSPREPSDLSPTRKGPAGTRTTGETSRATWVAQQEREGESRQVSGVSPGRQRVNLRAVALTRPRAEKDEQACCRT